MPTFPEFVASISSKLNNPLPGAASQLKMASISRLMQDGRILVPDDVKKGGVLVLLYPLNGSVGIVFMKRTEYPGVHSGQISFPGGGWEKSDPDITMTALREAEEEIGVDRQTVVTIGRLSDLFIPPSNFLVTPIVGYTSHRPEFRPDPIEVDKILEITLDQLLREETRQVREIIVFPDIRLKAPCFYVEENVIWGATAMMLSELIDLINQES